MLRNYFVTAIRNLVKYKIFSFINISGLSIGITAVLLITMYILNELNFEGMHENRDRIYRVNIRFGTGEGAMKMAGAMPALARPHHRKFPK